MYKCEIFGSCDFLITCRYGLRIRAIRELCVQSEEEFGPRGNLRKKAAEETKMMSVVRGGRLGCLPG